METPKWLSKYLKDKDIKKIDEVVRSAELTTSGEIVPMVVERSSTVGHVPLVVFFILCSMVFALDAKQYLHELMLPLYAELALWVASIVLLYVFSMFISRLHSVQRMFVSEKDRADQVDMRAEVEFYEAGLNKTEAGTGILLFVSVTEHRAVVLADKSIAEKLPKETWEQVVKYLVEGIKTKSLVEGFCDAIEECGALLAQHFPRAENDRNELTDHLIIK